MIVNHIGGDTWARELLDRVARGEIRPLIHAVRPLEEVGASFQELIDRRVFGKTVITPA